MNTERSPVLKKIKVFVCIATLAAALMTSCASGPEVQPEPGSEISTAPSSPTAFVMKPFHRSMKEEMQKSYDRSAEIIVGVFTGAHRDAEGRLMYYFTDFSIFDKETLSWGSTQDVIMQVRPDEFTPEIIWRKEFKRLIDLDKTGICWDYYQGERAIFLVEERLNLIFLEIGYDEASNTSYRNLLDAYPVTDECRAKDVFNLMIQDLISKISLGLLQ